MKNLVLRGAVEANTIVMIVIVVLLLVALIVLPMITNKKRQKQVSQVLRSLHVSSKSASHTVRVYISWHLAGNPRSRIC